MSKRWSLRDGDEAAINNEERRLWVLNDQGLYNMWRDAKGPLAVFIREHKEEIDKHIHFTINRARERITR
jgi:hypothetical protein